MNRMKVRRSAVLKSVPLLVLAAALTGCGDTSAPASPIVKSVSPLAATSQTNNEVAEVLVTVPVSIKISSAVAVVTPEATLSLETPVSNLELKLSNHLTPIFLHDSQGNVVAMDVASINKPTLNFTDADTVLTYLSTSGTLLGVDTQTQWAIYQMMPSDPAYASIAKMVIDTGFDKLSDEQIKRIIDFQTKLYRQVHPEEPSGNLQAQTVEQNFPFQIFTVARQNSDTVNVTSNRQLAQRLYLVEGKRSDVSVADILGEPIIATYEIGSTFTLTGESAIDWWVSAFSAANTQSANIDVDQCKDYTIFSSVSVRDQISDPGWYNLFLFMKGLVSIIDRNVNLDLTAIFDTLSNFGKLEIFMGYISNAQQEQERGNYGMAFQNMWQAIQTTGVTHQILNLDYVRSIGGTRYVAYMRYLEVANYATDLLFYDDFLRSFRGETVFLPKAVIARNVNGVQVDVTDSPDRVVMAVGMSQERQFIFSRRNCAPVFYRVRLGDSLSGIPANDVLSVTHPTDWFKLEQDRVHSDNIARVKIACSKQIDDTFPVFFDWRVDNPNSPQQGSIQRSISVKCTGHPKISPPYPTPLFLDMTSSIVSSDSRTISKDFIFINIGDAASELFYGLEVPEGISATPTSGRLSDQTTPAIIKVTASCTPSSPKEARYPITIRATDPYVEPQRQDVIVKCPSFPVLSTPSEVQLNGPLFDYSKGHFTIKNNGGPETLLRFTLGSNIGIKLFYNYTSGWSSSTIFLKGGESLDVVASYYCTSAPGPNANISVRNESTGIYTIIPVKVACVPPPVNYPPPHFDSTAFGKTGEAQIVLKCPERGTAFAYYPPAAGSVAQVMAMWFPNSLDWRMVAQGRVDGVNGFDRPAEFIERYAKCSFGYGVRSR